MKIIHQRKSNIACLAFNYIEYFYSLLFIETLLFLVLLLWVTDLLLQLLLSDINTRLKILRLWLESLKKKKNDFNMTTDKNLSYCQTQLYFIYNQKKQQQTITWNMISFYNGAVL